MNKKIFDIAWDVLLFIFLGSAEYITALKIEISAFAKPIREISTRLNLLRTVLEFDVSINYQVCKLRFGLNEKFDPTMRRITIEKGTGNDLVYVYLLSENRPVYLPVYLGTGGYDFVLKLPDSLQLAEQEIRRFVNRRILQSKKYIIVYV
jgi:hypothetical protein